MIGSGGISHDTDASTHQVALDVRELSAEEAKMALQPLKALGCALIGATSSRAAVSVARIDRQRVAIDRNGFGLVLAVCRAEHLPPVATGCARWAP
jgi:hypothetical protein